MRIMKRTNLLLLAAMASTALAASPAPARAPDLIVLGSNITTSDDRRPSAKGFAVTAGRFSFVGGKAATLRLAGPKTRVVQLGARRVLPGLVDAHIHPLGIVDVDVCSLDSKSWSLRQIADIVRGCLVRYKIKPGEQLAVALWNFSNGNQTDADYPTIRTALDKAAPANPVELVGNDGHHSGFNSASLATAKTSDGRRVGLSAATLAGPFKQYRQLIGVDAKGEPSGGVNEDARALMNASLLDFLDLKAVMAAPERVTQRLAESGITAILDAATEPQHLQLYDTLSNRGQLTAHATLAQYFDPSATLKADGSVDYDRMVAAAVAVRDRYAHDPLIRADTVKLFADGVAEGDPLAIPPTLPNAPLLAPYLQPIFGRTADGKASFSGRYVDTAAPECRASRAAVDPSPADIAAFTARFGFHPAQCLVGMGKLQHPRAVIMEYVRRMHAAGFSLHIHAIGDAAVHTAIDALEAARAGDAPGAAMRPDTIAHAQLVTPGDIARIGRDRLFMAMTYAWAYTDPEYDLSVIPFVQRVNGDSYAALHVPGSFYERQAYPAGAMKAAGATLVAGSDAPVETRDPRPFVNMQSAVTRSRDGTPPLGEASQRLTIAEIVRAYTIDGARSLGRESDFGSIAVGKSADFIVLDQDVMTVAADKIAQTKVVQTWFRGRSVFDPSAAKR